MDVRQLAFLAGQPAAVKPREHFCGIPKRGLAFILANAMFWQPLLAQADGIVVSAPGTSLGQAGNGVPIVNIAAPNASGLSHNQFHDYNVGANGVILNNATNRTQPTQLGGIIVGNPNLQGAAANTILNEVNGGSPSQLRGYTEVAGQSARVIVANPYGISCNGCGFINTPRVTLTTGKPVLDNGRLDRFQVDQGSVSIDGAGLNANNVDSFEIITRSAKINAEIQAKNLTIVAGRNDVNAQTLNATARADDGSAKPELAIDSSALGGMYAGAIKLVGTEAGVGVRLAGNVAASGGDIQLDANGHLSVAQTSATGAVNVKAASLDAQGPVYAGTALNVQTQGALTNQQTLVARDSITLSSGGQLTNNGIIEAGVNADTSRNANGDISLTAQNLNNIGKSVIASRSLTVTTTQTLTNQGGTLSGQQNTRITAATLDNQNKGRVLGNATLDLKADQVLNSQGLISSNGNLSANLGHLNNHNGEVSSAGNTTLTSTSLDNSDGQVTGDVALNIGLIGALNNQNGVLGSGKSVSITAAGLDNSHEGSLVSDGSLTARISGLFDNQSGGDLSAKGAVDVQAGSLDNRGGSLTGKDRLTLRSDSLDNRMGKVRADKDLQLDVGQLDNRQQGLINGQAAVSFNGTHLDNRGGLLSAVGPVRLDAASVDNSTGRISSKNDLTANIAQLTNQGGELVAQGSLTLSGKGLDNRNGGLVGATKALKLSVDDVDNRAGEMSSAVDVSITGQSLNNSDNGKVLAGTDLGLKVAQVINQTQGLLFSKGATSIEGQSLDNSDGSLVTQQGLDIRLDQALSNLKGLISSEGTLTVNAASLDSTGGSLSSAGALSLTTLGALINQRGSITTDGELTLSSQSLNNSQNGLLSGKGVTRVTTGTFDNTQGGRLISGDTLDLTAAQVSNGVASRIASDKALIASVTGFDQQGGELFSKTSLSLDLNQGQLNNQNGLINAPLLMLKNLKDVNNQGGEISSAQVFTLAAQSLDNSNGKLISNQGLTLRIDQALTNVKGLISAAALDAHSASLDNTAGLISSHGALGLSVDGQLVNQGGTLIADGDMQLNVDNLDNTNGQIAGKTQVTANVTTLNNQGGQLIATGGLQLTGATLDNRQGGLVGATNALQLTVGAVDNRGGELSSKADVTLTGNTLDNSDAGQVIADGVLALTVDQVINRAKGLLSGKAGLSLTGNRLDNSGGSLTTRQNLTVGLTGDLDNSQGLLSAEGTLGVNAASLTNTLGSVSSAGALTLATTGAVANQGGEIVTDAGLTLNSASLDNRNKGNISGKGAVLVNTGAFDNSHAGSLNSGDSLNLTAAQLTNQDGGRIASATALTVSVSGLDQQGGQLFSNTSLDLDLNHGQLNNQNGLINAPLLVLKNLKDVNNQGGEISSAQAFTVAADSLDNSNGKLLSNQGLTLRINQALTNVKGMIAAAALDVRAASLDNSGGTPTSRASLELNLDGQLNNQNQGLINATTDLNISSTGLNNQGGSLLGSAIAIDFGAATGDLNNSAGLITTAGTLSINHLRDLTNQSGEISSSQSLNLSARALDNSAGKLISNNLLAVNAGTVLNQGGLISGWQGLSLNTSSLDNRNNGTLSSRSGDVGVTVSGAILNSGAGALVSQKALTVTAASLDNSTGGILSSGSDQTLTISGLINNAQGGLIDSGATLAMQAMTLGNAGGTINAQQALSFIGTTLDNSNGTLVGNGAVTLDLLGALTNTNGKLSSAGPLVVQRSTQINNQGGQLASQGLMTLLTGGLDNRNRGTVAANDQLTLTTGGAVQNSADGLIYSQNGGLHVQAASLANAKGTLQSQGNLSLTVGGDIDSQSGRILAKTGELSISAGNLDNRGGVLSSLQGAFTAHLTGVLKNGYDLNNNRQGGITQAQRLNLTTLAGIDNYGGRISAQTGDAIVTTTNFDNRNGGLYAKGRVSVTGGNFDNSGDNDGQIAGNQIDLNLSGALNNRLGIIESDTTLAIKAASLDNQTGQLRALGTSGKTNFQIGGLFDNRNGILESANTDLSLGVGNFLNGGGSLLHVGNGTFDISTANVTGAGGSIVTRGGLSLNADSWINSSVIQAGRLNVNVNNFSQTASGQLLASNSFVGSGGNWYNDGLIASDGSMSLNLGGTYWGNGRVSSLGTLGLSAAQLNLNNVSSIAGGGDTTINVGGQLTNAGRLTSATNLNLTAGAINNLGTLGSGQQLTVTTGSLVNDHGLIFSGGDMSLRVNALNNSYANIYSLGNLKIDRDGQGGLAGSIVNSSASIQSDGSMSLAASTIQNIRAVLTTNNQGIYTASITEMQCIEGYNAGDCGGGKENHVWQILQRDKFEVTAASAASSITAGGNLSVNGGDLLNQSSTIATGGSLTATVNNLTNSGIETGETETSRVFRSERTRDAGGWYDAASAFTDKYWYQSGGYNANDLGGLEPAMSSFIGTTEAELPQFGQTRKLASSDQSYAAVIQAAGAVNINAQNNIDNSVVRPGYNYVGSGPRTGTGSSGSQYSTRITLNQQLPPNLAQQQVNPLALPGFSLPTGQNGLFRLSGQGSSTPVASGPQSWAMGGASLTPAQRQQPLPTGQARDIQLGSIVQVSASAVDLSPADRQVANVGVDASAINASTPGADPSGAVVPGRSTAFTVNRVQGLPASSGQSKPQKYLIETNPVLTDLKQFMSSDYLLANLGYNPDQSAKRLGDGFYEQKLIQQAVVARTGQRFIDGQTSDEALFKYLMNNAIASKDTLNLALGVTLTSEQVAALTHDIVWMENAEVNGEQVLVPVLYLANANNRLAANGALIQGSDVTLIAGKDLNNVGTLRASHNLSAAAGNDLVNSGLVEAGNRLDLLAGNNLINKAGGIIAGRDVSLTAINGDVINERTVTTHESASGYRSERTDFVDNAARVEAANNLTLNAGRDINNSGGVLKSGADTTINAGRDVNITSAEQVVSNARGSNHRDQTITQNGSSVDAGRDLTINAGRDLTAIASQIDAKRDIAMAATENLTLASAADEQHSYSKSKKVTSQEDHVQQVSTTVNAGGSVALSAGNDMEIVASRIQGGGDIDIDAARDLTITSAKDESASFYLKKSKGSFGRSSSNQQESYDSTNVASVIKAGHDLTVNTSKSANGGVSLDGGRDVTVIGSQLKAGNDLIVGATNDVAVLSGIEEHGSYSKKTKSGFLGLSKSGKSELKTTATQVASELSAGNDVVIAAGNDVRLRASTVEAGNDSELRAGLVKETGDINLVSANDTAYSHSEQYKKKTGLSVSGGFLSISSAKEAGRTAQSSTSVGSQVVADRDASLQAERDINLVGSSISAGRTVSLDAGRDVNIVAAQNASSEQDWKKNKQSGIGVSSDDNGVSFFAGADRQKEKNRLEQQTAAASHISAGLDLAINAKRDINQTGSDLKAANDIDLTAGRNINIDAAREARLTEQQRESERNGLSATISHNYGNTKDAVSGAGKGEDGVSKGSSTLKGVDAVGQFLAGPTGDAKFGNSKQSTSQEVVEQTNRPSTLNAGNDLNLSANNDVTVKGSQLGAGRDINVKGRDVAIDVAKGSVSQENSETQSWGGIHGGTSGGFKIGVGGSHGVATQDRNAGSSTAAELGAGRDINLSASNDLSLTGTQAKAGRDINLKAGNDLSIRSAQNSYESENNRSSGGGEVGLAAGNGGVGVYASVSLGKGNLEREGQRQQEAYLYAGNRLGFKSGRDTTVAGSTLRGDEVVGRVGRDLNVSSVADTGKAKGKEFDINATVTVGLGVGVSGSVGYGQTTGKTLWVEDQASITAKNKVDIRTEKHTQLDGALIASDSGNLKLDTGTLGFSDIAGKDKEHGYYLNVGGTYGSGGSATQDASQVGKGKEGESGWSVNGWNYERNREQTVRATVGAGDIVVRQDAEKGVDSTAGLNRDVTKANEVTKDDESRTDLYASSSSIDAALQPGVTLKGWVNGLLTYDQQAKDNYDAASTGLNLTINKVEAALGRQMDPGAAAIGGKAFAEQTLEALIASGMSRPDAMGLMSDGKFQQEVMQQLQNIEHVSERDIATVQKDLPDLSSLTKDYPNAINLAATHIEPEITDLQESLRVVSDINVYIAENPEKAQAVGFVLALAQGPKGVIQLLVSQAVENTSLAETLLKNLEALQADIGKALATKIEGRVLDSNDDDDRYLIGGGALITSILTGALPGGKRGKNESHVTIKDGINKKQSEAVSGGPHRETSKPVNDGLDSHHCPAQGCYKGAPISSKDGPAIKMSPEDHKMTASNGSSPEARAYREKQEGLLAEGKLKEAIQMDVDDIRSKFGEKYEAGIKQMLDYASKLNSDDFKR